MIDEGLLALVAVDLVSGARTILSDDMTPNAVNAFQFPRGLALDSANNRALVIDSVLDALIAVDLSTGARSILSDATTPDAIKLVFQPYRSISPSTA